jgi:uncharacterized protein YcfJ
LIAAFIRYQFGDGKIPSILTLVVAGAVLLGGYVGIAVALKARDVTDFVGMVRARLGR